MSEKNEGFITHVEGFIRERLDIQEDPEDDGRLVIRLTIRLEPESAAKLDVAAKYLKMKRTGCATRLLVGAIEDATNQLLDRDPAYQNLLMPALLAAMHGRYEEGATAPLPPNPVLEIPDLSGIVTGTDTAAGPVATPSGKGVR